MKSVFLLLVLAALPAIGGERVARLAPISLYTQFQQEPPKAVIDSLQNELAAVMAPMGLHFDWRALSGVRGNEVSVELAVVTFKGRCDVSILRPASVNPGALGWTHVSDGIILPFSDVDCDRIRNFVQKDLISVRVDERESVFGRALARVLAHELYHIFANTQHHGSDGVGKAAYTVRELLSGDFHFQAGESLALRTSKVHALLVNAAITAAQ